MEERCKACPLAKLMRQEAMDNTDSIFDATEEFAKTIKKCIEKSQKCKMGDRSA